MGSEGMSAADVAAVTGGNRNGYGFGSDGAFWLLVLLLFGGYGGFGGNRGGGFMGAEVQRGFDQQATQAGLSGIQAQLSNGFMSAEVAECNRQMNTIQTLGGLGLANVQSFNQVNNSIRDVINNDNRLAQNLMDKLCQLELDAVKNENTKLLAEKAGLQAVIDNRNQTDNIVERVLRAIGGNGNCSCGYNF